MSHILRETSNLKHHIVFVWFDITCTLYIVRTCNTGLKCQFAMFCEDMWFVGLVGNHGDNNPTFAIEKTNKRCEENHSKASQTRRSPIYIYHLWIMNEMKTLSFFVKENSRTNDILGICNENDVDVTSRLAHVYCQIHNGKHFQPRPVWFLSIETVYSERPQPFSITKEFSSFFSQQSKLRCLWLLPSSMLAFFKGYIKTLNWIAQPLIKLCLWMYKVLLFENAKLKY